MAALAKPILAILRPLGVVITALLAVARVLAVILLALMVVAILAQIVFRYGLGDALNWSEEAARFGMLWMTGLMAPVAYRHGGFVAIDMLERALPARAAALLVLLLTTVSLVVIVYALPLARAHVQSGCLFRSSTLWLPFQTQISLPLWPGTNLTLCAGDGPKFGFEWKWNKMPLAVTYASLYVGLQLLLLVAIETVLRALAILLGAMDRLPLIPVTDEPLAE